MSNEKFEDVKKQERQNIPPEVWDQLPEHIKKEIDPDWKPPAPKPIFEGASNDLTDSLNRLRDGFEKIGLTLIGRMGEFATTLERVMMIMARMEKVENLVAEVKYMMKNVQKSLDQINMTFNKDLLTKTLQEGIKEALKGGVPLAKVAGNTPIPKTIEASNPSIPKDIVPTPKPALEIKPTPITETNPTKQTAEVIEKLPQTPEGASEAAIERIVNEQLDPKAKVVKIFEYLHSLLTPEVTYEVLTEDLDQTRDAISKCYKWVPTLYDIGKSVRKFKSKKGKVVARDLNELKANLDTWKEKICG